MRSEATSRRLLGIVLLDAQNDILFHSAGFFDVFEGDAGIGRVGQKIDDVLADLNVDALAPPDSGGGVHSFCLDETAMLYWQSLGPQLRIGIVEEHVAVETKQALLVYDELTGLGTRRYFRQAYEKLCAEADFSHQAVVVMTLDLDRFKPVNDALGHHAGDAVLKKVVGRIHGTIDPAHVLARLGGDEFALAMLDEHSGARAEDLAQRIIDKVSRPYLIGGAQVDIGLSIGMVMVCDPGAPADTVLRKSDIALYQSKMLGRRRGTWFEQRMADEIDARRKLEIELRRAILLDQLDVVFEPQLYLNSQSVHALRSGLVWNHPEHGRLLQRDFVDIAADVGLVPEISRWHFTETCRAAAQTDQPITLSFPVLAAFMGDEGFVNFVSQTCRKLGVDMGRISFEFSESALLRNQEIASNRMLELSRMGARLSLDDFGSGIVALSYLRVLPFSEIKVDFSRSVTTNAADQSDMAGKIAELGVALGLRVLATGIDSDVYHTVLSGGTLNHVEKIRVGAPVPRRDLLAFLSSLTSPREV